MRTKKVDKLVFFLWSILLLISLTCGVLLLEISCLKEESKRMEVKVKLLENIIKSLTGYGDQGTGMTTLMRSTSIIDKKKMDKLWKKINKRIKKNEYSKI